MDPITQAFIQGAAGASGGKTDVEDVFSNWTYRGNNTAKNEPNGIDLADKGGFVWIKDCTLANNHALFDTERGTTKMLRLGGTSAAQEVVGNPEVFSSFDSNGFTHGYHGMTGSTGKYASWTWAKEEGFFDVVKWTGDGNSGRQIPHNLGSVPGFVMTKALDNGDGWRTLHSYDFSKVLYISGNNGQGSSNQSFVDPVCNATHLIVSADGSINASGQEYIAYIFAGGPSTAATARCVEFDGSSDELSLADNDDWNIGDTFTIEAWIQADTINDYNCIIAQAVGSGSDDWYMSLNKSSNTSNGYMQFYDFAGGETINSAPYSLVKGQWYHVAIVNNSGTAQWYINGTPSGNSGSLNVGNGTRGVSIGSQGGSYKFDGEISNLRLVNGTAVYTSAFKAPTEPLTNIANTKLLCCNGSTPTSSTVTPGTISKTGNPQVPYQGYIPESPFLDLESYKFGEGGDQNLIKCGRYTGNTDISPEIYLGWEPQFVMIKSYSTTDNWCMFDNIRGMVTGGDELYLYPNLANTEYIADRLDVTPTGFKLVTGGGTIANGNGSNYVYVAIRRPDPLVGKPTLVGTDSLFMSPGAANDGVEPKFRTSNFPVDFMMMKTRLTSNAWLQSARLMQPLTITSDSNGGEVTNGNIMYDYMDGWGEYSTNDLTAWDGWGFGRDGGFDVVTYQGNGYTPRHMPHNLAQTPEMIWIKNRGHSNTVWVAGHKDLNGGTNPWDYWIRISGGTNAESTDGGIAWGGSTPSSTHFSLGSWTEVNHASYNYVAFLFASVTGVSKLGSWNGDNTGNGSKVITTGFQPRFIIIRCVTASEPWVVLDSMRGLGAGNDQTLNLASAAAQVAGDQVDVSSTGFSLKSASGDINASGHRYIYYAHA